MGGKKSPDYQGAALAQGEANREVVRDQTFANRPDQYTPWGSTSWNPYSSTDPATGEATTAWQQTQSLTPELQRILNQEIAIQGGRSDIAGTLTNRMGNEFGQAMDWEGLSPMGQVPIAQYTLPEGGIDSPYETRQRAEDSVYNQAMSRIAPQQESQRQGLEIKMRNQGLRPEDQAWQSQMESQGIQFNDQDNQALWSANQAGLAESGQMYGQQMGMNQNAFNQAMGANQQNYGQSMGNSAYANQIRQQQMTESMTRRGFSLNEINALLSGQQVGMPTMPSFSQAASAEAAPLYNAAVDQGNFTSANNPVNALLGAAGTGLGVWAGLQEQEQVMATYIDPRDPFYKSKMQQAIMRGEIPQPAQASPVAQAPNPFGAGSGMTAGMTKAMGPRVQASPDFNKLSKGELASYAAQDYAPKQKRLAQQKAQGLALLQSKTPGARQVGNVSAMNIGEGIASGLEKGLGAYMMFDARGKDAEVEAQASIGNEAKGLVAAAAAQEALDLSTRNELRADTEIENQVGQFNQNFKQNELEFKTNTDLTRDANKIRSDMAAIDSLYKKLGHERLVAAQDFSESEGELTGFQNLKDPNDIIYKFVDKLGTAWNKDGEVLTTPFDTAGYIIFDSGTGGTTAAAQSLSDKLFLQNQGNIDDVELKAISAEDSQELAELNAMLRDKGALTSDQRARRYKLEDNRISYSISTLDQAEQQEYSATRWNDVLRDPVMQDGMGFKWSALVPAYTGFAIGSENATEIKEFQRKLKGITQEGMAADFASMKLGQITKNEFESIERANLSWKDTPYGAVSAALQAIPIYERGFNEAIELGTHTDGMRDSYVKGMKDSILYAAVQPDATGKSNFPVSMLEAKGIDVQGKVAMLVDLVTSGKASDEQLDLLEKIARARKREKEST